MEVERLFDTAFFLDTTRMRVVNPAPDKAKTEQMAR